MNRRRPVSAGSRGTAVLCACAAALLIVTPASAGRLLGPVLRASGPVVAPPASRSAAVPSPLTYHGGHVMQTSTVHAIYWTGGMPLPAGYRTTIDRYFADVATDSGKTSNVYAAATEYHQTIGGVTSHVAYQTPFAGSAVDTTAFVKHCTLPISPAGEMCVTDADIQARVIANAIANGWPTGASDAYFVITPPGMGVCYATNQCSDNLFCAYHSWTGSGPGEGDVTTRYAYAVEPYQQDVGGCDLPANPNGAPADITINTISHEHNEMLTDPFGAGWLDANGLENGDKCRTFNPTFD